MLTERLGKLDVNGVVNLRRSDMLERSDAVVSFSLKDVKQNTTSRKGAEKISNMSWTPLVRVHDLKALFDGQFTLQELGDRFPFLDRENEMNMLNAAMAELLSVDLSKLEAIRGSTLHCFGGVSGSGKTRLAREAALCFNKRGIPDEVAFYCRVDCAELKAAVTTENLAHLLLESLLLEHSRTDLLPSIADFVSQLGPQPLRAILDHMAVKGKKAVVVVNLDEAQHIDPNDLVDMLFGLSAAKDDRIAYFPIPTGLNLQQLHEAKTKSNRTLLVHTLEPVRNLGRILPELLELSDWKSGAGFNALLASLDGVPRLMLPLLAALGGLGPSVDGRFLSRIVDVANVREAILRLDSGKTGALYQSILTIVEQNAPAMFTSLADLSRWDYFGDLLACVVSAAPVNLHNRLGDKTVSDIVSNGWALLVEDEMSRVGKTRFHLELPLLYLHSGFLNDFYKTSHLRHAATVLRSPQKPLTTDDSETLDLSVLHARVQAYSALKVDALSLDELFGGSADIPTNLESVDLMLKDSTPPGDKAVLTDAKTSAVLDVTGKNKITSFICKEKAAFADSGISFPSSSRSFDKIVIEEEGGKQKVYRPSHPKSFLVLVQSKRFLSSQTRFDAKLIRKEFKKVQSAFSQHPFMLALVTDQPAKAAVVPDDLREWVVVVDGNTQKQLYGPMMHKRRTTAALISQKDIAKPTKLAMTGIEPK